jgi:hypothetical protein
MDGPITWQIASILGGAISTTAYLTWFVSRQFSQNRHMFYRIISLHNKEDDDRFEELSNEIWRIHVRNAKRDGDDTPRRKTLPRRRYLQESFGDEDGAFAE